MPDYIEFVNWPEQSFRQTAHCYDSMTLEERFEEYIRLKIKHPRISDEKLSKKIGKGVHYFAYLKKQIRNEK